MKLSRRIFLRGAGAAVALPALEAMLPSSLARAQMSETPRRFLGYYVPNGIHMRAWTPAEVGANYVLTPILAPLQPVKDDILVLSGVSNLPARPDGPGDHASGTGAFLTAAHPFKTEGTNIRNGISVDQAAAAVVGGATLFPSLQLGAEGGGSTGNCDSGYSCAYARNISWSGPATPLAKEVNPQAVFDRLFAGIDPGATGEQLRKRKLYKLSILDFVREDANRLSAKLGATDRRKVDEYLTGLRELETRLRSTEEAPTCTPGARPEASSDVRNRVRNMSDLMVMAFQCDLTRIITFMLGNAGSNRVFDFLGIGEGHHQISHHQDNPANFAMLQTIDIWEVEQLSYLIQGLKRATEADGTPILDNTVLFFSSEIEDGNSHSHRNMPIILAGKNGGAFRPGRHVRYSSEQTAGDLFVSILQSMRVNTTTFGDDGTAPLSELA